MIDPNLLKLVHLRTTPQPVPTCLPGYPPTGPNLGPRPVGERVVRLTLQGFLVDRDNRSAESLSVMDLVSVNQPLHIAN